MLAIFFYLTSFFDLQEWVPTGDKKIKKNKKKKEKKIECLYVRQRDRKELDYMKIRKRAKKKKKKGKKKGTKLYETRVLKRSTQFQ